MAPVAVEVRSPHTVITSPTVPQLGIWQDGTYTRDKGTMSMSQSQAQIRASKYALGEAKAAAAGVVMAVVFALQPWRECPEDDVAAGCVALPHDMAE